MTKYVAIINTPGNLPDSAEPPPVFDTANEAWGYLAEERRNEEDESNTTLRPGECGPYSEVVDDLDAKAVGSFGPNMFDWDGTGSVNGFTPGYEGDRDLGVVYEVQEADDDR